MSSSSTSSEDMSVDETHSDKEFKAFKTQLFKVQGLVEEYNQKIMEKTLCREDLIKMNDEMIYMTELEKLVTKDKMKSSYVLYKIMSLKMIQDSYRICNWLMEKRCNEMDNVFTIETFLDKIIKATRGKEDPLAHLKTLFAGVYKNTDFININFYGNIKLTKNTVDENAVQPKREIRRAQKRAREAPVIPEELQNEFSNNELKLTLMKIIKCLKLARSKNNNQPVCFYKFSIDPFSLTYTVENLFNLASLVKDNIIKISLDKDGKFLTLVENNNNNRGNNANENNPPDTSSLFTINYKLWKEYIHKYNITERLIQQD